MESSSKEFAFICAGMIHSDNIVDLNEIKYQDIRFGLIRVEKI